MTKLAKYLKPYIGVLLLCIVLLFTQAMSDLNLPNFMSDIINIGIQQNGIEHASPEAISEKGYDFITTFMTDDQKQTLQKNYKKITPEQATDAQKKKMPLLETENAFILNTPTSDTFLILDPIFGKADWTFINFIQDFSKKQDVTTTGTIENTDGNLADMDISKLYALTPMLKMMPPQAFDTARDQANQTPESMQQQTASLFVREFYKDLGMNTARIQSLYILKIGAIMLGLSLLGVVAAILVGFLASRMAAGVSMTLRKDLFKKVESFSNAEFNRFSTASLITRSTNDVTQTQTFLIMAVRMICYAPIMGIGGVIMALKESLSMSWIIALAVILLICMIGLVFSIVMPKFKVIQQLIDKLNLVMRENLNGMSVIRAFGNQEFERKRFETENTKVTKNNLFVNRAMVFMMPAMMMMMNCITLLIIWIGAHQIADSAMQVGNMMAFMQYAMQIIMSFLMISMMFVMVPRASVSSERIAEVLNTEPNIINPENPKTFPKNEPGHLVFNHVSFHYEGADEEVLHDITFEAKPGETTAFIGSTGSGKSTLINLIPRFYDVTDGSISIDGVDIRDVTLSDLRNEIGYIPQKGILFSGTIDSNLRYGRKDADVSDVEKAANIAQAMDFINSSEEGFERNIAQGGANVSGGQKQRLSIARALVKKPAVYIFDDSFSALDFRTDITLRSALKGYTKQSTVLIVAQRINTIMNAEQIIVLDNGHVAGIGTHSELLKTCKTYGEIASSQLSKEELENV
ncbi:MAG: ABC transporter ATP-binding protein [Eubacterium sp.]